MKSRVVQLGVIFAVLTCVVALIDAKASLSKQQADAFAQKVLLIAYQGNTTDRAGSRRTAVTESELNSWFAFRAQPLIPKGVSDPKITMVGSGRVLGQAIVDLDAVAKKRATGGMLDPWSYIGGKVPVSVTGVLHTREGVGRFEVQSAEVSSVPVPRMLLQELVAYYSRTPEQPDGISIDDPFELPAGIRAIEVEPGQAVVVQ
jgi:hypothetical protein